MEEGIIRKQFLIPGDDLTAAGEASSDTKKLLVHLGVNPYDIKRAAVAMYEAEINAVIHANGGTADVVISTESIKIIIKDEGPGIADLDLALQEGYSTATDKIREMGFGAGMGLPNMKRYADELDIQTEQGKGTVVTIIVYFSR